MGNTNLDLCVQRMIHSSVPLTMYRQQNSLCIVVAPASIQMSMNHGHDGSNHLNVRRWDPVHQNWWPSPTWHISHRCHDQDWENHKSSQNSEASERLLVWVLKRWCWGRLSEFYMQDWVQVRCTRAGLLYYDMCNIIFSRGRWAGPRWTSEKQSVEIQFVITERNTIALWPTVMRVWYPKNNCAASKFCSSSTWQWLLEAALDVDCDCNRQS